MYRVTGTSILSGIFKCPVEFLPKLEVWSCGTFQSYFSHGSLSHPSLKSSFRAKPGEVKEFRVHWYRKVLRRISFLSFFGTFWSWRYRALFSTLCTQINLKTLDLASNRIKRIRNVSQLVNLEEFWVSTTCPIWNNNIMQKNLTNLQCCIYS